MKKTTIKTIQSRFKGMKLKTDATNQCLIFKGKYHRRASSLKPVQYARLFFTDLGKATKTALDKQLKLIRSKTDSAGNQSLFYAQYIGEARVHPGIAVVFINKEMQLVYAKVKCIYEEQGIPKYEDFPLETALSDLRRRKKVVKIVNNPEPSIYVVNEKTLPLCWNIKGMDSKGHTHGYFYDVKNKSIIAEYEDEDHVDATTTGIGINSANEAAVTPVRIINVDDPGAGANLQLIDNTRSVSIEVYDMAGSDVQAAVYPICEDDDGDGVFNDITNVPRTASNRPEVDAMYHTGLVADYYLRNKTVNAITLFNRDGWAGDGSENWINNVHYRVNSQSSFYSRSNRKIYHADGDGTDLSFKPGLDTSAHEWNHAVQASEITGGTNPDGGFNSGNDETFTIKEALSDIFAGFTNKESGWRMGTMLSDDIATATATFANTGFRFRSLVTPSVSDSPDHFEQNACTLGYGWNNTGQVGDSANYRRIGILNKAAYLQAMGGQHPTAASDPATFPIVDVIGLSVSKLENIYYYALTMLMDPAELLLDYREDVILACETLYPADECCCKQIMNGFDAVGIYEVGNTPPAKPAGPDLFITPWGSKFGTAPYWQSPDVYTKDALGNVVNPLKGIINNLCANVTNKGDVDAIGVEVSFYYSPYGMGYRHEDFAFIATEIVDIPANTSLEVCTDWDLTDLTFDNAGLWPFPIGDFDHFCVQVIIEHPDDVDTCNNETQHNFTGVLAEEVDEDGVEATFMVSNPTKKLNIGAIVPEWEGDLQFNNRLNGIEGLLSNTKDLTHLLKEADTGDLPDRGILFAIRPGEKRKLSFRLDRKNKRSYNGKVKGKFTSTVTTRVLPGKKTFSGNVYHLQLPKTSSSNNMIALVRGIIKTGEGKLAAKGRIKAKITHKSGKFSGRFYGVLLKTNKKISMTVKGQMRASAHLNYSIHMNGAAAQGFDMEVKIV